MAETKNNSSSGDNTLKKQDWVRKFSFIIIGICIALLLVLLGLMAWRATNNNPEVYRVIVTSEVIPDSIKISDLITYEQADSLINAVREYDNQLTQKYQYLVEQKEQDSQVFYWGSLIVGIVIAVFGWFGFQSFTTIEDKAKSKAANVADKVARRIAWKETKNFLEGEGKKQINTSAQDILKEETVNEVKNQVMNDLNTTIETRMGQYMPANKYDVLENKIESLETSIKPEIEKAVRGALNDLFDKLRKQTKVADKGKEEKK